MILDDIATLLSSGGIGTLGSTGDYGIYLGALPPVGTGPEKAVAVYETGGVGPTLAMSGVVGGGITAEHPRIQVVVRTGPFAYSTGRQKVQDVVRTLHNVGARTVNGVSYFWINAVQSPFSLSRDEQNRELFAVNFDVCKQLSTA